MTGGSMEAAGFVGIPNEALEKSPFELSGGQKRRVAIAGVIAMEPEVLILDEPTAGLDPRGSREILANIRAFQKANGAAIVMVSHSMEEVAKYADRIVVINDSHIAMDGKPKEIFSQAKELIRIGLDVPQITRLFLRLRALGLDVDPSVYTVEQAKGQLLSGRGGDRPMLKDVTLGQYFPGNTVIHRLDPRTKLIMTIVYIAALFIAKGCLSYGLVFLFLCTAVALSRIRVSALFKGLKPLIIIMVLTAFINLFYTDGDVLVSFWIFTITKQGLINAFFMVSRIMMLIAGTFLLTYTTSPISLTDGLELLLNPLKKIKVPVHELSMMMCIALRFIPTLIEETDKIMSAQKARGADFESGNLIQRAKALIPILVPLFISSFSRADDLATAWSAVVTAVA